MKCTKCNHILPEDSEFCQYCGSKVEPIIEPPAEEPAPSVAPAVPVAPTAIDLDDSSDPLKALMEAQAKETIRAMEANRTAQPNNEICYNIVAHQGARPLHPPLYSNIKAG